MTGMSDKVAGRLSESFEVGLEGMLGKSLSARAYVLPVEESQCIEVSGWRG
jgi:hypothetical protein